MLKWLLSLFKRSSPAPIERWLVDRDGRVYLPARRIVLKART